MELYKEQHDQMMSNSVTKPAVSIKPKPTKPKAIPSKGSIFELTEDI